MSKPANRILREAFLEDRRRLLRLSHRFADRDEGEEAVQELWLRIMTVEDEVQIRNPGGYLSRMLINLLRSGFRKTGTRRAVRAEVEAILEGEAGISAERVLGARQTLSLVAQELDALPERTRRIFLMNRVEGMTYRQIAEALSISEQTVHYHMRRAMDRLLPLRKELDHGEA